MKILKCLFILFILSLFYSPSAFSSTFWINDLKSLYQANNAIIYAINIRTFNAKDIDGDGIINEEKGEVRGNFLNAIDRLDELVSCNINTVLLLPVTPVGKVKAFGTAGSLYAASSFNELNPQLKSSQSKLSVHDQMKKFVDECHKRKLRVIVDLPCCGAYDLYLKRPELFLKNKDQKIIIPSDWSDVRFLNAGSEQNINMDVYALYKNFVDMMIELDVDGIRANVASIKPASFWKKLIEETRLRNPQFLFIAETSLINNKIIGTDTLFIPCDKLLIAGFDGYHGKYSDLSNWNSSKELYSSVLADINISKKYSDKKSVLGNFATHDQISPILANGSQFSKFIIWLSTTLPVNSYYVDGFYTGDDYLYYLANKKASKSYTDDEYYFVHRGKLDIFNFSRKPEGKYFDITNDFILANHIKKVSGELLSKGNFVPLHSSVSSVFAYARSYDKNSILVIGNLDFKTTNNAVIRVPKLNKNLLSMPIKINNVPIINNGKITSTLSPGEIQVLYIEGLDLK